MKQLIKFAIENGLKQADAIILRKKILGMVDHYAIFMGWRNNVPVFVANYRNGVREVPLTELQVLAEKYEPTHIEPFEGSETERKAAIQRAKSRIGENAYSYTHNNCEHFKNFVHFGFNSSKQVKTAGQIAIGASLAVGIGAIAAKNPKAGAVALGALLLGLVLIDAAED